MDLRHGIVVHAVRGDRDSYRPLRTCLTSCVNPLDVAKAFRDELDLHELYVADLNGLIDGQIDWSSLARLASCGMRMIVDAGLHTLSHASRLSALGVTQVVVALETLPNW